MEQCGVDLFTAMQTQLDYSPKWPLGYVDVHLNTITV
jgi:hypothetical protein